MSMSMSMISKSTSKKKVSGMHSLRNYICMYQRSKNGNPPYDHRDAFVVYK